jgi:hypothetical protein
MLGQRPARSTIAIVIGVLYKMQILKMEAFFAISEVQGNLDIAESDLVELPVLLSG